MNLQPGFNEIVMMDRADLSALFFSARSESPAGGTFLSAARESRGAERGICGQNGKEEGRFSPVFGRFRSAFGLLSTCFRIRFYISGIIPGYSMENIHFFVGNELTLVL